MKKSNIELGEKEYLSVSEAMDFWNLSHQKFYRFLENGPYDFLAWYGKRRLIIRITFEKYLREHPKVKEELANGKCGGYKKRLKATGTESRRIITQ